MIELLAYDDLGTFGEETSDELVMLDQDLYHRLIERPGSNPDDPNRGLGLIDRLSAPDDPNLSAEAEAELRKDPRVLAVTVSVAAMPDTPSGRNIFVFVEADAGELGIQLESVAGQVRRVR